jgi:5'-3' exoribonuclease 1
VEELMREAWEVEVERLRKGLMAGVRLATFFPGFPTLQHITHTARLKKAQVRKLGPY